MNKMFARILNCINIRSSTTRFQCDHFKTRKYYIHKLKFGYLIFNLILLKDVPQNVTFRLRFAQVKLVSYNCVIYIWFVSSAIYTQIRCNWI